MVRVASEPVRAPTSAGEPELAALGPAVDVDWYRGVKRARALIDRGAGRRTARAAKLALEAKRLWIIVIVVVCFDFRRRCGR